ncbi:MAG: glycoside hydrolase N-terminal domain-containing protein [Prevotellaceae bacterium]|nr:glycoside hydrolase N-terminal domain-containing protein [Prevotellaceae bacterium]
MRKIKTLLTAVALGCMSVQAQDLKIWYNSPVELTIPAAIGQAPPKIDYKQGKAKKVTKERKMIGTVWENYCLPLGNSSLGASLLQSAAIDCIILNEKSLWKGGPASGSGAKTYWTMNPDSRKYLPIIRQAFAEGKDHVADSLTKVHFSGTFVDSSNKDTLRFGTFTTMGEWYVRTGLDDAKSESFYRDLNLQDATSHVTVKNQGVTYRRSYFVSYPDQALVMRYEADKKGKQNLTWTYLPNPDAIGQWTVGKDELLYAAKLNNNQLPYAFRIKARANGGTVAYEAGKIVVKGATSVDFILTAATAYVINKQPDFTDPNTYYGQDPIRITADRMQAAAAKSYKTLYQNHVADYRKYFDRMSLAINPDKPFQDMPTDTRLDAYKEGADDPYLEALYYQFARYMTIAASRGATLPMNLQGIWSRGVKSAWNSDYHNNINLQMNYWPTCTANLMECFQPLVEYLQMVYEPGRLTAKAMYGGEGWTLNISTNPYGFTAPTKSPDMIWNLAAINGPWLATHLWEYYTFTLDKEWLRDIGYPLLKGSADFVCNYLWKQDNGLYTSAPSTSPEHGPVDKGVTFANAVAKELLMNTVAAAKVLNRDAQEVVRWTEIINHIEPYRIGRYGQLMEWSKDIDNPNDNHRHTNHLFGLYPGHTISLAETPKLAEAAKVVLEHRGDLSTGWSMGWKLNLWAHLHDGNRSYKLLRDLLSSGTNYNLWDTHPPFQIDGNLGGLAGITEMMIQSTEQEILLLPAIPDTWKQGTIKGVRARGNYTLDINWNMQSQPQVSVTVYAHANGTCKLRYKDKVQTFSTEKGKRYKFTF